MPITFPTPTFIGQTYSAAGKTWQWNGYAWDSIANTAAIGATGATGIGSTGATGVQGATGLTGATGPSGGGGSITPGTIDNAVLRADGTSGTLLQNSDIIIDDATTATQNNVAIIVDHQGQTNSSLVLTPEGTGAFILGPKPDGTATGGNARGIRAVDLQSSRNGPTEVATGSNSVCIGISNTSTANTSIAIGSTNLSSANQSIVIGSSSQATSIFGVAIGRYAKSDRRSMYSFSGSSNFSDAGDCQYVRFILSNKIIDNNPTELFLDGTSATQRLVIPSGKMLVSRIILSGIRSDGTYQISTNLAFQILLGIKNVSGTTTAFGGQNTTATTGGGAGTFSITYSVNADDTNDSLKILITNNIVGDLPWRFMALVEGTELAYGT